jgi:hypothetical protein
MIWAPGNGKAALFLLDGRTPRNRQGQDADKSITRAPPRGSARFLWVDGAYRLLLYSYVARLRPASSSMSSSGRHFLHRVGTASRMRGEDGVFWPTGRRGRRILYSVQSPNLLICLPRLSNFLSISSIQFRHQFVLLIL